MQIVIYGPRGTGCQALAERIRRENVGVEVTTVHHLTMEHARAACGTAAAGALFVPAPLNCLLQPEGAARQSPGATDRVPTP